jgi:hypothetical protein
VAGAQTQPFVFTLTTTPTSPAEPPWAVDYEAGYGKRAAEPFGFDGIGPRLAVRGVLGRGLAVRGQAGLRDVGAGPGLSGLTTIRPDDAERLNLPTAQLEVMKDLLPARGVGLAVGLGVRREWQGPTVLLGRIAVGHSSARSTLFGNVRFERALDGDRDAVDLVTSAGWLRRYGSVHLGFEAIGEDLEGLWDSAEAEGGAKLFAGPSVHFSRAGRPWSVSVCGGPILHATRTGRSSSAARELGAGGSRYALRLSFGYSF